MRKFLFLFMMAITIFTFNSCNSNSPSATVEKSLQCMKDGDYDGVAKLIYMDENTSKTDSENARKLLSGMIGVKASTTLKEKKGLDSWEITSEKISDDGNKATVKMTITYGDGTQDDNSSTNLRKDKNGNWLIDLGK